MPNLTSRLPILNRALTVRADSLNKEARTVDLVFATERPVPMTHWEIGDYDEILSCDETAADLGRLRRGGALLSEHDRGKQIGVIEACSFDGRQGVATARFDTHALAEQEWQSVQNGIRRNFSVSYQVKELTAEKVSDDDGNVYRATRWEPLEISLVSVPADVNCQAVRSAKDNKTNTQPVQITIPSTLQISDTMKRSLPSFFHVDNGLPSGGAGATTAPIDTEAERQKLRASERASLLKTSREITEAADAFKLAGRDVSDLAKTALAEDWSVDRFRSEAIKTLGQRAAAEAPTPSRIEVVGERQQQFVTPGEAFINSKEFQEFARRRGSQRSARIEDVVKRMDAQSRATSTTAIAGFTNPDYQAGIKLVGVQRLTIRDLVAQGVTGSNAIIYRREVSHTNAATMVAEGAAKPEATFDTEEVTAPVRKIAVWTKETEELVMDFPAFQSYINARLPFMVEQTEEAEILNGDGTGQHLTGILNTSGILTQALSTDTVPDALYKAMTKIRTTVGGFAEPDGFVVNPLDWQDVRLSKDDNHQYYADGPFMGAYGGAGGIAVDSIWGKPVVVTTAIAEGTALCGAFKLGAQVFDRQGLTIETTNTDQDDFIKNLMTIRAEKRLALAVYFAKFFCTITGI